MVNFLQVVHFRLTLQIVRLRLSSIECFKCNTVIMFVYRFCKGNTAATCRVYERGFYNCKLPNLRVFSVFENFAWDCCIAHIWTERTNEYSGNKTYPLGITWTNAVNCHTLVFHTQDFGGHWIFMAGNVICGRGFNMFNTYNKINDCDFVVAKMQMAKYF